MSSNRLITTVSSNRISVSPLQLCTCFLLALLLTAGDFSTASHAQTLNQYGMVSILPQWQTASYKTTTGNGSTTLAQSGTQVKVGTDGSIYVDDYNNDRVVKYVPATLTGYSNCPGGVLYQGFCQYVLATPGVRPWGLAVDSVGDVYLSSLDNNQTFYWYLQYLGVPTGSASGSGYNGYGCTSSSAVTGTKCQNYTQINTTTTVNKARGMWVDSYGNVFIGLYGGQLLLVEHPNAAITPGTIPPTAASSYTELTITGTGYVSDVVEDQWGNIILADYGVGAVTIFKCGTGSNYTQSTNEASWPSCYGATSGSPNTLAYSSGTNLFSATSSADGVNGVALDGAGNLYASFSPHSAQSSRIYEYPLTAAGSYSTNGFDVMATSTFPYGSATTMDANIGISFDPTHPNVLYIMDGTSTGNTSSNILQLTLGSNGYNGYVNVGNVALGSSVTVNVNMVASAATATPTSIYAVSQNNSTSDFSVVAGATTPGSSYCNTGISLSGSTSATAIGGGCVVPVTFTPSVIGPESGAILFINGSQIVGVAYLQGTGVGALANFSISNEITIASGLSNSPTGLEFDGAGNLYYTATGSSCITQLAAGSWTPSTVVASSGASGLSAAKSIAMDGAGILYVADSSNANIQTYTPSIPYAFNNFTQAPFGVGTLPNSPNGIFIDPYGSVYIANTGANNVQIEPQNGVNATNGWGAEVVLSVTSGLSPSSLSGPKAVAVDAGGDVIVADSGNNRVVIFTLTTPIINGVYIPTYTASLVTNNTSNPSALALDAAGDIYVADTGNNRILKESFSGGSYSESVLSTSALNAPLGIAIATNGNIFLADSGHNRILEEDVVDAPTLTFAALPNTSSAQQTVILANDGNSPLSIVIPNSGSNPSVPAGYSLYSSGGSDCPLISSTASSAGSVAAGTSCLLPISFTPTTFGTNNASLTLVDNSAVASGSTTTQSITLNGASYYSTSTTITTSATSIVPGQPITLTATVSGTGAGTPTGTVTFSSTSTGAVQGILGIASLVNGVATYYGLVWVGSDAITATYNGNTSYSTSVSNAISVANNPVTGKLSFNWPFVAFGQPTAYGTSVSWPVTIQNLTGISIAKPSFAFTGSGAINFSITSNTCTSTMAQGATCNFNVTFAPSTQGTSSGATSTATLTASTTTSASYSNTLSVSGISQINALSFNWPFIRFAPAVAQGGVSTPWPITLHNQSGATTFANPAMTFTDASFSVINDTCSGQIIAANANCTFSVVFSPIAADMALTSVSSTMTVTGNSNGTLTNTLPISGLINQAPLTLNWPVINFQPQVAGISSANPWPVTVTNNSGLTLSSVSYTFTNVANYQTGSFALTNTCSTLAGGASCTFYIASSPQTTQPTGAYSATLVISGTGSAGVFSTTALPLSGTTLANGYTINWNQDQVSGVSTIDFGPQNTKNVTAGPWPITLYNNTPSAQTLTLTPSLSQFTIDSGNNTCSGSVPAGGSCTFGLDFTPAAIQSYQGTLTLSGGPYSCYFNTWGTANK